MKGTMGNKDRKPACGFRTYTAVGLSFIQNLKQLIDGRVGQPDGGGCGRQRPLQHTGRVTHKLMRLPIHSALALVSVIVRYLYLYPKVLVPFAQQSIHILQHQLCCSIQQVKVKEEAQQ